MKRIFFVVLISMIANIGFAQTVTETQAYFAGDNQNALIGRIPKGEIEDISHEWKKLMRKYKASVSGKEEILAEQAKIKKITPYPVKVYARVEQGRGDEIKITVAFDLGGYFMTSSQQPEQFRNAQKFLEKFVLEQSKDAYKSTLKNEQKVLSKLEKEKKKMEKLNKKIAKKNEKLKKEMQDNIQKIKDNQTTIDNTVRKINQQTSKIKDIKSDKPKR
ncbi:MAG: hypothetical protein GX879_05840 [Bacteroidales bacterium]|nr:hypothetical protein [Bacteroidales bacterium]